MRIVRAVESVKSLDTIPVDFRADPDGAWEYETLAQWVGFEPGSWERMSVGALTEPYDGFPEGAAVVALTGEGQCSVALVDCTAMQANMQQHPAALPAGAVQPKRACA